MGKITVKHYLNTDRKEEQIRSYSIGEDGFIVNEEDIDYPVYIQITVNRKTTKLRSFTNRLLTKKEFSKYLDKGTFYNEKKICNSNSSYYLKNEIKNVTDSLDYFYNIKSQDQDIYPIKNVADFFMLDIDGYEVKRMFNNETLFTIDNEKYIFLYEIIKEDVNPAFLVDFFSEKLNTDIYLLFDKDFSDYRDSYKAFELFFQLMPKDDNGKVIGKMINWYNGELKELYKKLLDKNKHDSEMYLHALDNIFDYLEKYRIKQQSQLD
jgi:hypothetical protein